MSNNSNIAIRTIDGAITGAAAGYLIGTTRANNLLYKNGILKTGKAGSDEFVQGQVKYVTQRISANKNTILKSVRLSKIIDIFNRVGQKAEEDFASITKKASNIKLTWITALAASGALIGFLVGKLIANKEKANQEERAQESAQTQTK